LPALVFASQSPYSGRQNVANSRTLSKFQIIDLNGKINEIHILPISFSTTYSYTNENDKLIYGTRANRTSNQINNLLGDIASGDLQPIVAQVQVNNSVRLVSFMPQINMKHDMKFHFGNNQTGWWGKDRNPWNQKLSRRRTAWRRALLPTVGTILAYNGLRLSTQGYREK
jgi:hypothetical protein